MDRRERNGGFGRWTGGALAFAALALAGQAQAFTLDALPGSRSEDGDALVRFELANPGVRTIAALELVPSAGAVIECVGRSDVPAGLSPNASETCIWQVPAGMDQAVLAAHVRYADGAAEVQQLSWTESRGASFPQGVVLLAASGVHNDSDFDGLLDAGESIDYGYRLVNVGNLALDTLVVTDLDGVASCPGSTLAPGQNQLCTRSHVVTAAEAGAGQVNNTIEVTGFDALGLPVQSSSQVLRVNLGGSAGIAVIKSPFLSDDIDNSGFASLGDIVRYDFLVTNTNADALADVELIEPDPTLIDTPITCAGTTLGGNAFAGNGLGGLAAGDSVLCTATYEIRQADVDAGQALNLVNVTGTNDLNLVVNGSGASALVLSGPGALTVSKNVTPPLAVPGQDVVYTITVSNTGPVTLFDVQIIDPLPIGISSFDWTCSGTFCPNAAGSGPINELIPAFPAGQVVVYTVTALISPDAPDEVINTVTVLPPGLVACEPDGSPTPCEADAPLQVRGQAIGVPTLDSPALLLLVLSVLIIGLRARP